MKHLKYQEHHEKTYLFQEFKVLSRVSSLVHIYKKDVLFAHLTKTLLQLLFHFEFE